MQQTDKYKLNKPGVDDPIAIAPLNENMDKVEGALGGLDARIQVLELKKVAAGTYTGTGKSAQFVPLGFTPAAVFVKGCSNSALDALATPEKGTESLEIVEGGFRLKCSIGTSNGYEHYYYYLNSENTKYSFIAVA